jgi:ArsR family transcriptional regulator
VARAKAVIDVSDEVECCPSVLAAPLDSDGASELAVGFNALGDPVRLRLLSMLAAAPEGEICVCEFIEPIGKNQGTISHRLTSLETPDSYTATGVANGCGIPWTAID